MKKTHKKVNLLFLLFTITLAIVSSITISCSDEDSRISDIDVNNKIEPTINKVNAYFNSLPQTDHYQTKLKVSNLLNQKVSTNTSKNYSQDLVNDTNLNYLSDSSSLDVDIIAITTYKSPDNTTKGIVMHTYLKNEQNMYINVYDTDGNENLIQKVGFPMIVNGVLFEDLNYIGNKYYPTEDIKSVSIYDYDNFHLAKNYNDLFLSHKTESLLKKDLGFEDSSGCSLAVHHCVKGGGKRCFSTGCSDGGCGREGIEKASLETPNLSNHHKKINKHLTFDSLYNFRDRLNITEIGKKYVDMYYAISEHFIDTIDSSIIIDIAQISPIVAKRINYYLVNDDNHIIIDNMLINKIKNIAEKSKYNSTSEIYTNSVNLFIEEFETYKGKNTSAINNQLIGN